MPFTFSHPAIVLPFLKLSPKYISASAVIIGSMAPDFEYFIRMRLYQVHGHSIAGAFYYDLPVTLLSVVIFHLLVRDTLLAHLPRFLREKYASFYQMDWLSYARKSWYVIVYSAVLGIFSHLFWDAFTHAPGYFVQFIPFLQQTITLFNIAIPAYDLMQLISTLVGGAVLLVCILWPAGKVFKDQDFQRTLRYGCFVSIVAVFTVLIRQADTQSKFIATIISGTLIGMMLAPLCFGIFARWRSKSKTGA